MNEPRAFWPFSDVPAKSISIYDGPEAFVQQFAKVSRAQQIAFAGFWFQAEVLNGGLDQFFSNSTGVLAPEAVAAIREVGLPELAARLEEAMSWFGPNYPRDRDLRNDALEEFAEANSDNSPFDDLDDTVVTLIYDEGVGLEQAAATYIDRLYSPLPP